jgi:2-polyprenyl-6-methoxyphenol hydroxylase-like FAD-dependent oxidoreductase
MANNSIQKAIIIGGGIAGPCMALFLKKIGINSQIFEASSSHEGIGAGLNIASNGMSVLAELGLAEKIISVGSVAKDGVMKNSKGKLLAKFKFTNTEKYIYPNVNIKRLAVTEQLLRELESNSIEVYYNKKLVSIIQNENEVEAHFSDGSVVKGDILIGADGVRSIVRNFVLNNSLNPSFTGIVGSGGFTSKTKIPNLSEKDLDNLSFVYGTEGFFGYGGVSEDEIMWWTNIKVESPIPKENLKDFDQEQERKELLKQYGKYSFPIPDIILSSESFVRVNVYDVQSLPNWSNNRIILIGDAAHAVSPNAGQGASMALEDTMLLAKLIRDEKTFSIAFEKFETMRKSRVEKIVKEGRSRGVDKTIVSPFQQKIRELMIRIFVNLFAEKGNRWLLEYKIDWDK